MTTEEQREFFEAQLRECFGRVVYSHKTHEKCADQALAKSKRIKLAQIVLSVLTTSAILSQIAGKEPWVLALGAALSTFLVGLNSYTKDYDLGKVSEQHREAATKLWDIREKYFSLLTEIKAGTVDLPSIQTRRDELQTALKAVYASAPATNGKAYVEAQQALKFKDD